MKFTLAQLRKFVMPYHCSEELDLSDDLNNFEDIISVLPAKVEYDIKERGIDTFLVCFHVEMDLTMECSITLKEIPYHITADAEEIFSTDDGFEDAFLIENQTLDTKEAVLTNVLIQKPMKVTCDGVTFEDDLEDDSEPEDKINPAFAKLKDLL